MIMAHCHMIISDVLSNKLFTNHGRHNQMTSHKSENYNQVHLGVCFVILSYHEIFLKTSLRVVWEMFWKGSSRFCQLKIIGKYSFHTNSELSQAHSIVSFISDRVIIIYETRYIQWSTSRLFYIGQNSNFYWNYTLESMI